MSDFEDEAEQLAAAMNLSKVIRDVRESNEIEGIFRGPTDEELDEHIRFLAMNEITVEDLMRHVAIYAGTEHRIRAKTTDRHQIGSRVLEGGPHVLERLRDLLLKCNEGEIDPWHAHVEYEILHPFTDGNGRSGRALWHWMMLQRYGFTGYTQRTQIGFLHRFYYQAMQFRG